MKILFYILAAYLIYMMLKRRFGRSDVNGGSGRGSGGQTREQQGHKTVGEEMVQDPVCQSYVPVSEALQVRTRHGIVYFCGSECREKFLSGDGH